MYTFIYYQNISIEGWAPTRRLKDVVWGLNSLFSVGILE